MLKITLNGTDVVVEEKLRLFGGEKVLYAVWERMTQLLTKLQQRAVMKTSGPYSSTGALERSIQEPYVYIKDRRAVVGVITAGADVPYAWALEVGGAKQYPISTGKKALLFATLSEARVFAKSVLHPPAPRKAYLGDSVQEMKDEIIEGLRDAVTGVVH
jgi:hypothetical protein